VITGVYQILNKCNNKCYIGSSKTIEARKSVHFSSLRGGYHYNKHLQAAFNKYGEQNFEFIVIEMCTEDELLKREKYYISAHEALHRDCGYNKAPEPYAGSRGIKWTKESKDKLSNSLKEAYLNGDRVPALKSHTESARVCISESLFKQYASGKRVAPNKGKLSNRTKPIWCAQTQLCYLSIKIASEDLDIAPSSINKVLKGLRDNIKGYVFEYAKKPPQKEKSRE